MMSLKSRNELVEVVGPRYLKARKVDRKSRLRIPSDLRIAAMGSHSTLSIISRLFISIYLS